MAPRHSWQIESVATDQTINTPSNQTVVGVYVYFVTGQGNHGAIFLSNDKFTHDNVKAAVRAEAKKLDEIANLAEEF